MPACAFTNQWCIVPRGLRPLAPLTVSGMVISWLRVLSTSMHALSPQSLDHCANTFIEYGLTQLLLKLIMYIYYEGEIHRGADKSLARPERKQLQRQKILSFIYPIYNHNWRNISTIYTYNKTSIKRNILTIKQNTWEVGWAKDLSAPLYNKE